MNDLLTDPPPARRRLLAGLGASGVVATITVVGVRPISDLSPWLHLRVGEFLAAGGRFTASDPFSRNAAHPYLPTQWLPSVVTFELQQLLGLPAVAWLRALAILALFLVLAVMIRRSLPGFPGILVSGGVTLVCLPAMSERPQALGMVLLALTVFGWWGSLADGRPRWWLIPLAWVFASSHGLWSVGVGVGVLACLGRWLDGAPTQQVLRLASVVGLEVLASAVTPIGPGLLITPFTVGANGREFITEWQPGSLGSATVVGVVAMLAIVAGLALRHRESLPWSRVIVLAAVVALTVAAIRTGAPAALLAAPVLAESVGRTTIGRAAVEGTGALLRLIALVAVAAVAALPLSLARATTAVGVPSGLVGQLTALPAGTQIFAQTDVTGWMLWATPNVSPIVDIRSESYTPDQIRAYVRTYNARAGWEDLIDSSHAHYALIEDTSPLMGALVDVRNWKRLGSDAGYVLLGSAS